MVVNSYFRCLIPLDLLRGDVLRRVPPQDIEVRRSSPLVVDVHPANVRRGHNSELALQHREPLGNACLLASNAPILASCPAARVSTSSASLDGLVILQPMCATSSLCTVPGRSAKRASNFEVGCATKELLEAAAAGSSQSSVEAGDGVGGPCSSPSARLLLRLRADAACERPLR